MYRQLQLGDKIITSNGTHLEVKKNVRVKHRFAIHWDGWSDVLRVKLASVNAPPICWELYSCITDDIEWPYGNVARYHVESMGRRLSVSRAYIYEAFGALKRADVVRRVRKGVVLVDPHLVWAGAIEQQAAACERWDNDVNDIYPDYFSGDGRFLDTARVRYGQVATEGAGVREAAC